MIILTDEEMKAILRTVPTNPRDEGNFFSDTRFVPGRMYDPQAGEVFQPHESLNKYEKILAQIKRVDLERYSTIL